MTTISGLSVSQWLASANVSESNSIPGRNDDQGSGGSTTFSKTGDTVTISEQARHLLLAKTTSADSDSGQDGSSDQGLPSGASASAGGAGGMGNASSTSDQIEEIEKKIEKLGQEISALQSEALSDPMAKAKLGAKLNELAQLQAQLAELKQQQA